MNEPLVSVAMLTYNHAPYIAQAIEGVLQQKTSFPIELIIGEDCSTDGTREIVSEYHQRHPDIIRIVTSEKNIGATDNWRRTKAACRGIYLAFCEGDDHWHNPNKLQIQVDHLQNQPDFGMVSSDVDIYYNENKAIKPHYNYTNGFVSPRHPTIEELLWGDLRIWTCTVLIRRDLLDQIIRSDPYLHLNSQLALGDLQIWAELTKISKLSYIPETLATYRVLPESASRSKDRKKELRFLKSLSDIKLHLCSKYDLPAEFQGREEKTWVDWSLLLAVHEQNARLADEVRNRIKSFTIRDWARFLAAKYRILNYGYRFCAILLTPFKEKRKIWP